jgi:hypothetical protein
LVFRSSSIERHNFWSWVMKGVLSEALTVWTAPIPRVNSMMDTYAH